MAIGKVIKNDGSVDPAADRTPPRPRAAVMSAETFDANQEAKGIVLEARQRAAEIVADAEAARDDVRAKARDEGLQEGKAQATELLARAKLEHGQMLASSTREVLELALKVAEKILGADLERDPAVLAQMCASAVDTLRNAKALVIRVHPTTGAMIRDAESIFHGVLGKTVDITFRDDPEVELKGCIIQTGFGTIDAQLSTQIRMLKNVLLPEEGKSEVPA